MICDTRKYNVRKDWAASFKALMHWPQGESIVRVDGLNRDSLLVLRESVGIDRGHFAHDYLSELLRSAVVAAVSALDRYLHDLIVKHSWKLLTRKEDLIPKKLSELGLSALDARRAVEHLRKDSKARPGNLIKRAIQEKLHRDFTFQSPDAVVEAMAMLGVKDFWAEAATRMPGRPPKEELIDTLRDITKRRNQIVHEADLILTQRAQPLLRDVSRRQAADWVEWMGSFGAAVQEVVDEQIA